jgi:tRNA dimethylallyltransferase
MQPIIAIVGPTATGKTDVAIDVARRLGGEIISADSMAVYRRMDIGTAKPDAAQRALAAFHLIDVAEPDEPFHVSRFKQLAEEAQASTEARGRRVILAGGTGLYVRVYLEDYGLTETGPDPAIRARLEAEADAAGTPTLHARLATVDPDAAARIHPNDRVRISRALEVYERTGVPMSEHQARDAAARKPRPALKFGLTAPRDLLNERIDRRIDLQMEAGWLEEVRGLLALGYGAELSPMRALGYKELAAHLRGEIPLGEAVAAIKQETRRFAKRQVTWFKTDREIRWLDIQGKDPEQLGKEILAHLPA